MGVTRFKKTAECECGCDYGSNCGRKITFLFCYNRSVDIGGLYMRESTKGNPGQYKHLASMTDDVISALIDVLTSEKTSEEITSEDRELL